MSKIAIVVALGLTAASLCQAKPQVSYGELPIAFEASHGQAGAAVDFVAHGQGYGLSLGPKGAIVNLRAPAGRPADAGGATVRMKLADAQPNAPGRGIDALAGTSNYYIGNDPAGWRTQVRNYTKVVYSGIYPGVDLVYYGNQRQLEYDFVVAAGADPTRIAFDIEGADKLALDAHGNLVVSTTAGELVEHAPVIYQDIDGRRRLVEGGYAVRGSRVSFRLSRYDRTRPLVIDPVLSYASFLGGSDYDNGHAVAVGADGAIYVTGFTYSSDFPLAPAKGQHGGGDGDAFVARINPAGTALDYSTYLGGSAQDVGRGIAVDAHGDVYITGYTRSNDFPTTTGTVQTRLGTGAVQNAFATRLDAAGALRYSSYLGGGASDTGEGIAVDASGNAFVTGYTSSHDFPTTSAAFQAGLNGLQNAFVSKFDAAGATLVYSTFLGGDNYDFGFGIALDGDGDAYVTGTTYAIFASTFPTTAGAFQTVFGGSGDAFVSKLDASGATLLYSTFLGGSGYDGGRAIALDGARNAYVTGDTLSAAFPTTPGAAQTVLNGSEDAFVAKLAADGSTLAYSTYLGGSDSEAGYAIAVNASGSAYVTGFTQSADFPTTPDAGQSSLAGTRTAFVAELDASGANLAYSTYLGGSGGDGGYGIAADAAGNAYVTGYTGSDDFPVTSNAYQPMLGAAATQNAFVAKIAFAGPAGAIAAASGTPQSAAVGEAFGSPLTVVVSDANGHPVSGASVTFAAPASGAGAVLSAASATTGMDGTASVQATASDVAGSYTVVASVAGLDASAEFALGNLAGPAATLQATAGTPQSAEAGQPFATPLTVHVSDAFGNAAANVVVSFGAPANGASATLSAASAMTDTEGNASISAQANTTAGSYPITASVAGLSSPTTFALTNTAGVPAAIASSGGTPQSSPVGAPFAAPLAVHVVDANGNAVAGAAVTFAAPASGPSALLSATSVLTDADGNAAVDANANAIVGHYVVTAHIGGVDTVAEFDLSNTAGPDDAIFADGFESDGFESAALPGNLAARR